jgi:hypoxanthine phosphoribosyltransferase
MKSYDYAHRNGVRRLTWNQIAKIAAQLAELLEPHRPQLILGIARAGLIPATIVACSLRCELFPIRLTRRLNDQVLYDQPVWKVPIPPDVNNQVVALIDEIADTGQTLAIAARTAEDLGARQVITATLVRHSWANPSPRLCPLVTDEFVIFPWDKKVLSGGKWVPHPEIVAGLKAQRQRSPG